MNSRKCALLVGVALIAALPAAAQNYPVRPVRVIVPYAAGGNTDFTARAIGAKLTDVFGQQVIVDNRPGGATNIGTEVVAKAPPDGYTHADGRRVQRDQHEPVPRSRRTTRCATSRRSSCACRAPTCSRCTRRCRRKT